MNKTIAAILVVIIVGIGSFYVGTKHSSGQGQGNANNNNFMVSGTRGAFRRGAGSGGMGITTGEIISRTGENLVIKLRNGGSQLVFLTASTTVMKEAAGNQNDLGVGKQITVSGNPNGDGSLTTDNVQIRPNDFIRNNNNQPQ